MSWQLVTSAVSGHCTCVHWETSAASKCWNHQVLLVLHVCVHWEDRGWLLELEQNILWPKVMLQTVVRPM